MHKLYYIIFASTLLLSACRSQHKTIEDGNNSTQIESGIKDEYKKLDNAINNSVEKIDSSINSIEKNLEKIEQKNGFGPADFETDGKNIDTIVKSYNE